MLRASKLLESADNFANSACPGVVVLGAAKDLYALFAALYGVDVPRPNLVGSPAFPFEKKRSLSHRIYENKGVTVRFPLDLTKR